MQAGKHNRLPARWEKWLRYYSERKSLFGAERVFLIDDGSVPEHVPSGVAVISADLPLPDTLPAGPVMFRFDKRYGRSSVLEFPGWWRSFAFSSQIADKYGYSKMIHCESDAYVIGRRMAAYMKNLTTGWTAFWCPMYEFPETNVQVICGEAIGEVRTLYEDGEALWRCLGHAEAVLPFTHVEKSFVGDRYGEKSDDYPADADFVCQATNNMTFEAQLRPPETSVNDAR